MNQTALLVLLISILVIFPVAFIVRRRTQKPAPGLSELIVLGFAVAGFLSGLQILYQAFQVSTIPDCQEFLGGEGTVALLLGGGALMWVSGDEVRKLLFPDGKP